MAEGSSASFDESKPHSRCISLLGFGSSRMIQVVERAESIPMDTEVSIRVKFCGVGFNDLAVRQGNVDNHPKPPLTMGFECSGIVEAVGENVIDFAPGDRVMALTHYRSWSEQVCVPEKFVYKMPSDMTFAEAAALPMSYAAAYIMLYHMCGLRKGQTVLVYSAGGAIGFAIGQLVRIVDGVTLIGVASSKKHDDLRKYYNVLFDYDVDYAAEVARISHGGVDIVLDCLCGEDTNKGIGLLRPMGRYILYGTCNVIGADSKSLFSYAKSWWQVDKINPLRLFDENKTVGGLLMRRLLFDQDCHDYVRGVMAEVLNLYSKGHVKPVIDSVYAFDDVNDALLSIQNRENVGRVLLNPDLPPRAKNDRSSRTNIFRHATAVLEGVAKLTAVVKAATAKHTAEAMEEGNKEEK